MSRLGLLLTLLLFRFVFSFTSDSDVPRRYTASGNRMRYDEAKAYCQLMGQVVANIPSGDLNHVAGYYFRDKRGPASFWATFEHMVPANDLVGPMISANCPGIFTPGVIDKEALLYVLCEKGPTG